MSLINSASAWTNDDISPKKRIPSINRNKTVKKLPQTGGQQQNSTEIMASVENTASNPDDFASIEGQYQTMQGNSMEDVQANQAQRNSRVNQLINQMALENDGNHLANFHPLSHPIIQKRTDVDPKVQGRAEEDPFPAPPNPLQIPAPVVRQPPGGSNYSANDPDLGNLANPYSNYRMVYEPPKIAAPTNYYSKMGLGTQPTMDNKLMEKINYMVHMLEQQHNEKTSNMTEEFVLYTFLGVFIIFVVDSFARAGKYTR